MTVRTLFFQAILTSIIALYGCGGGGGGSTPAAGGGPTLVSIIVTSPSSTIAKGTSTPFTATGLYSNGTSSDVTFLAAWNSSHTAISTVTVTGLAISVDQGTTTISAVYSGKTATASLTVTSAVLVSLSATPPTPSIPKGLTQQFTARGKYSLRDHGLAGVGFIGIWYILRYYIGKDIKETRAGSAKCPRSPL